MFLLDANTWITSLRGTNRHLRARFAATPPADIASCSVVRTELLRGALRSQNPVPERAKVVALLAPYRSLPFDDAAADHHADIKVALEWQGLVIGPHDLLIAAIARANGLTVVTHNTREFNRVPGLTVEDWEVP